MYYYLPQPPYLLILVGLFISLTCGLAFKAILEQKVRKGLQTPSLSILDEMQGIEFKLPFLGTCLGIWIFLATGLEIFSITPWFSYGVSLITTIFIAALIWTQLGKLLVEFQKGGSKALDLDFF